MLLDVENHTLLRLLLSFLSTTIKSIRSISRITYETGNVNSNSANKTCGYTTICHILIWNKNLMTCFWTKRCHVLVYCHMWQNNLLGVWKNVLQIKVGFPQLPPNQHARTVNLVRNASIVTPYNSSFTTILSIQAAQPMLGARGSVVGWGTMLQAGKSRVRVLMRSLFFNSPDPSSRIMILGLTRPLREMSTRAFTASYRDNFTLSPLWPHGRCSSSIHTVFIFWDLHKI
jgi:hypothetical protein